MLSHRTTVETVNSAGSELLESSPGDEINHLRDQLDELNRSWKNLLLKTDERQKLLEAALQQVLSRYYHCIIIRRDLSASAYVCSLKCAICNGLH